MIPRAVVLLAAVPLLGLALTGCGTDSDPAGPEVEPPPPPGYTDPAEAAAAWADALSDMNLEQVTKLLEPDPPARTDAGFRFYPQALDVDDFPWLEGDSWDRAQELDILRNMMDSTFVSQVNGNSIDRITADLEVITSTETAEGILLNTHATFVVLWAADTGAFCDTRLEILLVKNAEDYYVMRSMRELALLASASDRSASVEPESWGAVKNLYR